MGWNPGYLLKYFLLYVESERLISEKVRIKKYVPGTLQMNAEMTTAAIVNFVLLKLLAEQYLGLTKAIYLSTIKVTVK